MGHRFPRDPLGRICTLNPIIQHLVHSNLNVISMAKKGVASTDKKAPDKKSGGKNTSATKDDESADKKVNVTGTPLVSYGADAA